MCALDSVAKREPRPSIAQLEAEGRFISLVELCKLYDDALEAHEEGSERSLHRALELQALLYLGFAARYFAPNRPGVLRVMGLKAGCVSPTCRAADCLGNYVDAEGLLHVVHDKTEAAHGPRPPLLCAPQLQALLKEWLAWGRDAVRGNAEDTGALFLYPATGCAMTDTQSSAYMPVVIQLLSGLNKHITHTSVRPARAAPPNGPPPPDAAPHPQLRCALAVAARDLGDDDLEGACLERLPKLLARRVARRAESASPRSGGQGGGQLGY
jgi:hypothetical protein